MTSDTTSPRTELPNLTSLESDAAIAVAWAAPGVSMLQVAARLKLAPTELREILERPHVAVFARAAREIELMHEESVARHNRAAAIHELAAVAKDASATIEMRYHAAVAILKALQGGPALPAARSTPYPRSSPRPSLPAPAKPPPVVPLSAPGPGAAHGKAEGSRPDQNNLPTPAPASEFRSIVPALSASPVTLRRAAGAPIARRAAPPPAPGRPP